MKLLKISAISAGVALAACSAADTGQVTRLAAEPALTGGTYSTGGGITVATAFRNVEGRTALCGLWSESQSQTPYSKGKAPDILASGAAFLDGKRLVTGLGFFRKIPPGTDYSTATAPCVVSDHAWRPGYAARAPEIRLPHQIVYRDRDGINGPRVAFRQTGPGALGGSLDLVQALFGKTVRLPLGQNPAVGGGRYSSGGGLGAAIELRRIGESTYACGVWAESRRQSPRTEKQAPEVLARGSILLAGTPVITDLRFLRRVPPGRPFAGRRANCIDTGRKWSGVGETARPTVRFSPLVVYHGPGAAITFSPSGPGA